MKTIKIVIWHNDALKVIRSFTKGARLKIGQFLYALQTGINLSMPDSRPLPSIGKGVHELRVVDETGNYRTIYVFIGGNKIYILHIFKKKTQKTPKSILDLCKKRLREVYYE